MYELIPSIDTRVFCGANITEKLIIAAASGYRVMEIDCRDIEGATAMCRRSLDDLGCDVVAVNALHGWYETDDLDECRRRIEMASEIRSPQIVAYPPVVNADAEQAHEKYAQLIEVGKEFGVDVVLTHLFDNVMLSTPGSAIEFGSSVTPDAKIVLSCRCLNGKFQEVEQLQPWQIAYCQVTAGDPSIGEFVKAVDRIGYAGPISVKMPAYPTLQEGYDKAVLALMDLKSHLYPEDGNV